MASPSMIMTFQKWWRLSFDAVLISMMLMTQMSWSIQSLENGKTVSVRINGDPSHRSGVVEVSLNGEANWSRVFRVTSFSKWKVGNVVCRQLGFGPPTYATSFFNYESLEFNTDYIDVDCQGNEESLSECEVQTNVTFPSSMALAVDCLPAMAKEFEVALVKMYDFMKSEGFVLVFVDGRWGPVCDSSYGDSHNLCTVVCKQMGFKKCNDYPSFIFGIDIVALPVLGSVSCSSGDILKTCDFVRLKNQTCSPYFGSDFYEVSCTNLTYDDNHATEYPVDNFRPDHRAGVVIISFVMLSALGMVLFLCQKARSEEVATSATTVVEEVPDDSPGSPQPSSLPPSYEAAIRNEAYPLPPTTADPPQENDRLLEHTSRYPSEPMPVYSTVPMTDPPLEPRVDSSVNYPPSGLMQPNLAFPVSNRPDPSLAYPPQGSLTNQIPQTSIVDPELPTYEAATGQLEMSR